MNVLQAFGHEVHHLANVIVKAEPKVVPVVEEAGEIIVKAQPIVDLILDASIPWASPLYNATVLFIKNAERQAVAGTTNQEKAASVAASLEPLAIAFLKQGGVSKPTQDQIQMYIKGAVMTLSAFQSTVAVAA